MMQSMLHRLSKWLAAGFVCLALASPAADAWAQGGTWEDYMEAATAALQHRDFAEAGTQLEAALELAEAFAGADPRLARTLNNLAYIYRRVGRYHDAEPLYRRSVALREAALGPDHPNVATVLNNLAGLYQAQRRYDEAEALFVRALDIRERALGPEHPDVATSLNNLAGLYRVLGRDGDAEPLFQRSLDIIEKVHGPDDQRTAKWLFNLSRLYLAQGRFEEARNLEARARAIWVGRVQTDR